MLKSLAHHTRIIDEPLDVNLEIPHIAYCEAKKENPQILIFTHPIDKQKGTSFSIPVVMNIFANHDATREIFGGDTNAIAQKIEKTLKFKAPTTLSQKIDSFKFLFDLRHVFPNRTGKKGACQEITYDSLDELPILKTWDDDGGKFITMGQVYTQSLDGTVHNVGMYRLQVFDGKKLGLHWQIHKDSNHLFHEYKKAGKKMPVSIAIGGDPLYTWCATAPLPHGVFELLMYGFIRGKKATLVKSITNDIYIPHDVDFVIEGWVDPEKMMIEGMFGDHTGYYTLKEPYPYLDVTHITSKKDPLFYATVVGKPPLEDKYMGYATERIFLPLLQTQAPQLIDYRMPENGVFHNLILAKIAPSYPGHSLQIMHALWGVGQMSFVKHALFIDDNGPDLTSDEAVTRYILNRITGESLLITKGVLDALDHSAPKALIGGKLGVDATGETINSTVTIIDDHQLITKVSTLIPSTLALKQYFTDTPNPITVIQFKKEKSAKEYFNSLKELKEYLRIVVFVDENDNDVSNGYMLLWRVTNNIDALRDISIENDLIMIDGTNKNRVDGFNREWPDDVVCNPRVINDLKNRGLIDLSDEEITRYAIVAPKKS